MNNITIEDINENILLLRKEVDQIKELLEEQNFELRDEVKQAITASRKRPASSFKSQQEIEKKFL